MFRKLIFSLSFLTSSTHYYKPLFSGNIWGNLVSSLVFSYEKGNGTENISTCGISFCSQDESKNPNLLVEDPIKVSKFLFIVFTLANLWMADLRLTVQSLCIGTDRSQQTVQTKVRLLLKKQSDQGVRCLRMADLRLTVQSLRIGTDRSQQTVQTKIRLLLKKQSDQGLRCLPFHQHLLNALMQCYIKLFFF